MAPKPRPSAPVPVGMMQSVGRCLKAPVVGGCPGTRTLPQERALFPTLAQAVGSVGPSINEDCRGQSPGLWGRTEPKTPQGMSTPCHLPCAPLGPPGPLEGQSETQTPPDRGVSAEREGGQGWWRCRDSLAEEGLVGLDSYMGEGDDLPGRGNSWKPGTGGVIRASSVRGDAETRAG